MRRIKECITMALPCLGLIHDQTPKPPKKYSISTATGANGIMHTLQTHFDNHNNIYWMNLSRFTALLIILNISLFFVTELVTRQAITTPIFRCWHCLPLNSPSWSRVAWWTNSGIMVFFLPRKLSPSIFSFQVSGSG